MKKIILLFIGIVNIYAFEVNTHQAITRCALTQECSQNGGISNLENFIQHSELKDQNYIQEKYEKYNENTYQSYGKNGEGFKDWNISIGTVDTLDYHGMIEAGSVLEDSVYPHALFGGDGRFNNHFYAVQIENTKAECRKIFIPVGLGLISSGLILPGVVAIGNTELMRTNKTLCGGFDIRTDNIDWVFNKNRDLGQGRVNDYGMEDAFDYFKKSFEGNETERTKYQAKFFVTLGMMSHMLQDLHSPAHVRDGSHAQGDYLEMYGRYDKGFNLKNGHFNPKNEPEITSAIHDFDMPSYLNGMNFKSLEDFYYKEAEWVSKNFFSETHNDMEKGNIQTGTGIQINDAFDKDTIFDINPHLAKDETYTEETANKWNYIKTSGKVGSVYGPIAEGHDTVAMEDEGILFGFGRNEHMIKPTKYKIKRNALNEPIELEPSDPINEYATADTTALKDTAINVIPRAVASTQGFLNFFFRGQIEVKAYDVRLKNLQIINESNTSNVNSEALTTFKEGGKFYVYYVDDENVSRPLKVDADNKEIPYILSSDLLLHHSYVLDFDLTTEEYAQTKIDAETKFIVVYDGKIGDDMGGSNHYGYGMRGVSADVAEERFTRNDENETVNDNLYNIQWQDNNVSEEDVGVMSFYAAQDYCSNLDYSGYTDWRLPFIAELDNLVFYDAVKEKSKISSKFKNLQELMYWSANVYDDPTSAYDKAGAYYYYNFNRYEYDVRTTLSVVCVRDKH